MTPSHIPHGTEFKVNTTTVGFQAGSSITGLADGGYVVTWHSQPASGADTDVFAQRYDANGVAVGIEFQVNSTGLYNQEAAVVTALDDGGFVVVWQSWAQDGQGYGIYSQRYDAAGAAVGGETRINQTTLDDQSAPAVSTLTDGSYVVTWSSYGQDGSYLGVYGRVYHADGTAAAGEFQVNSETLDDQRDPSVSALSNGGLLVSWESWGQDGSGNGVYAQRYDASGTAVGVEFRVNSETLSDQSAASVTGLHRTAHAGDASFLVTWQSNGQDGSGSGIFAQRYDENGNPVGAEFQVNSHSGDSQKYPVVAAMLDGGFVIAWRSQNQDGDSYGVFAQRFDANGQPIGDEYQVNTHSTDSQLEPSITVLEDGAFVISWSSNNQDGDDYGIYAQQYEAQLIGTMGADDFYDNIGADWIDGRAGDDIIYALDGDNIVYGRGGHDSISAQEGNDEIHGGRSYDDIAGGLGDDHLFGGEGDDLIWGDNGDFSIIGGDDVIRGGAGNDNIRGEGGNDRLFGGSGVDRIEGGFGNDRINGGSGIDLITGGHGKDILTGGAGADVFFFTKVTDSQIATGIDRIRDFEVGVDIIVIDDLSETDFTFLGDSAFTGTGPEVRAFLNGHGNTVLQLDVDGDGLADMKIFAMGDIAFTADDFAL